MNGDVKTMLPSSYMLEAAKTDVLTASDFNPVLLGLYGEVGGIMATVKKHIREGTAYPSFQRAAVEEFGDTLWYLAALCRRADISLDKLFLDALSHEKAHPNVATNQELLNNSPIDIIDRTLFDLGQTAAALLGDAKNQRKLNEFAVSYLSAVRAAKLSLEKIAEENIRKTHGAFIAPSAGSLIDFDSSFEPDEQLPRQFKIRVRQRGGGRSYLQWNGVFIGDPLTDNIVDSDGYRFHDVFHFSYAAILHWSPVMRALIKHKRKSIPKFDETEDSGRAIVVEEGLTAWIFGQAKKLSFFAGQDRISLDTLKTIEEFVAGYEVEQCPLKLWERAILDGYSVFRQIRNHRGGWIIGDREQRTISFAPLGKLE